MSGKYKYLSIYPISNQTRYLHISFLRFHFWALVLSKWYGRSLNNYICNKWNCFSGPYIRIIQMNQSGKVVKKKKTVFQDGTKEPVFNETLNFDVSYNQVLIDFDVSYNQVLIDYDISYKHVLIGFDVSYNQVLIDFDVSYNQALINFWRVIQPSIDFALLREIQFV